MNLNRSNARYTSLPINKNNGKLTPKPKQSQKERPKIHNPISPKNHNKTTTTQPCPIRTPSNTCNPRVSLYLSLSLSNPSI